MRTNIEIDDATLEAAMRVGPYKTKKEAVDAGLKLLARQAAYREILKWRGKLNWDGDDSIDWVAENAREAREAAPLPTDPGPPATATTTKRRAGR